MNRMVIPAFAALLGLATLSSAHAGSESLSQDASDPTASLLTLQYADWYTGGFHNLPGEDANQVVFRPVIPFSTGNLNHIMRATVPIITDNPVLSDGLSDIVLFDLVVFEASWGRWGVGPVALFPTGGKTRGADKWAAGPAAGFTATSGKLLWACSTRTSSPMRVKDRAPTSTSASSSRSSIMASATAGQSAYRR